MTRDRFALTVFAMLILSGPAWAAECADRVDRADGMERTIAICTAEIDAGVSDKLALGDDYASRANAHYRLHQTDAALADYDSALAALADQPQSDHYQVIVANKSTMLLALGRPFAGMAALDLLDDAAPDSTIGRALPRLRGEALLAAGFVSEALPDFDEAAQDGDLPEAVDIDRAIAAGELGDPAHAVELANAAIAIDPNSNNAFLARGHAYLDQGRFADAAADLRHAMALGATDAVRHLLDEANAGESALEQRIAAPSRVTATETPEGDLPSLPVGATHDCTTAFPKFSRGLGEEGNVVVSYLVDETGAIRDVSVRSSSGIPRLDRAAVDCISHLWRNTAARKAGKPVASSHLVKIVFHLNGTDNEPGGDATNSCAWIELGDYDRAIASASQWLAAKTTPPQNSYYCRGLAYFAKGDWDAAEADFIQVRTLMPNFANIDDALALVKARRTRPTASGQPPSKDSI